jgi:hypothetical protein
MSEYRYLDEQRKLGESLVDIPVAPPRAPHFETGALDRIATGNTVLAKMAADVAVSVASVPQDHHKHELKKKLQTLLFEKQQKELNKQHKVASFVARVKRADPSGPDVTPGAMTSGTGQGAFIERRPEGIHQGPAANLIARGLKQLRMEEHANKVAASRFDKEVLKGNVGYHHLDPRIPANFSQHESGRMIAKGITRPQAHGLSAIAPAHEARLDRMDQSILNNEHLRNQKLRSEHQAQQLIPAWAKPGGFGQQAAVDPHAAASMQRQIAQAHTVHNQFLPNMGPATTFEGHVASPTNAGPFMQQATQGQVGGFKNIMASHGNAEFLPAPTLGSGTMGRATLQHEKGEQALVRGEVKMPVVNPATGATELQPRYDPHASHLGARPLVEERQVLHGRPTASGQMDAVRQLHPDDRLNAKLMRQVGHHPGSPIAPDSRRERALMGALERNKGKIKNTQMLTSVGMAEAAGTLPRGHVSTLPDKARAPIRELAARKTDFQEFLKNKGHKAQGGIRQLASKAKGMGGGLINVMRAFR